MKPRNVTPLAAAVAVFALLVAGCGGGDGGGATTGGQGAKVPDVPALQSLGKSEGALNVIAWAGYAEDGSNDKTVDWVHPFEKKSGCKVNVKIGNTSDEMVALMKTGQYDVVSASGDATLRLIYGGDVAPVNTDLVPNYATVQEFLKKRAWNSVGDKVYGIPHGWGANLLMWNTDKVKQPPTSWAAVFDNAAQNKGKVTAYDSPIYIADAALYLMKHQPDLGIKNPYALDQKQFDAALGLLRTQRKSVGEYWADYTKEVQAFESGDSVIGTTWQVIANLIDSDGKAKIKATIPQEGATGWSDTWMVSAKSKHPNCSYRWLDWIVSAKINAEVAQWFGEAPAQAASCSQKGMAEHCRVYHAADKAYSDRIWYWTTPTSNCLDGRTDATCVPYAKWTQAWTSIKG